MDLETFRERLKEWPREQLRAAVGEYRDDYPADRLEAIEDELQRRVDALPEEDPAWETSPGVVSPQATNCWQIVRVLAAVLVFGVARGVLDWDRWLELRVSAGLAVATWLLLTWAGRRLSGPAAADSSEEGG